MGVGETSETIGLDLNPGGWRKAYGAAGRWGRQSTQLQGEKSLSQGAGAGQRERKASCSSQVYGLCWDAVCRKTEGVRWGGAGEGAELGLSANTIQEAVEKALKGCEEVGWGWEKGLISRLVYACSDKLHNPGPFQHQFMGLCPCGCFWAWG